MQQSYTFKSDWFYLYALFFVISALPATILIVSIAAESDVEGLHFLLFLLYFLLGGGILFLLEHMPASFRTEEDAVVFRILLWETRIPYASIRHMEVQRHYTKVIIRGDVPHYEEELHITAEGGEYTFTHALDIDMNEAASHPETLQAQFEEGMFQKLMLYLETKVPAQEKPE